MEEIGGVGDIGGVPFMWLIDYNVVESCLETGECIIFDNDADGWWSFLLFVLVVENKL